MRAHVSEHMLNMCAGLPHLCVKEKVNFRLIRWGVADEQAFSAADSAKSQESKKKMQWNVDREYPLFSFQIVQSKCWTSGALGQL